MSEALYKESEIMSTLMHAWKKRFWSI